MRPTTATTRGDRMATNAQQVLPKPLASRSLRTALRTLCVNRAQWRRLSRRRTESALRAVPYKERDVIVLALLGGFSECEVARILDTPPSAVQGRLGRGRGFLKAQLLRTANVFRRRAPRPRAVRVSVVWRRGQARSSTRGSPLSDEPPPRDDADLAGSAPPASSRRAA